MRSGDTSCLIRARGSVEVSKFKVLGTWVLKGDLFIQNRFWVLGYLKGICSYRTDWEHRTEGVPPHILLSLDKRWKDREKAERSGASVVGSTLLSEARSRPRRGAGQPKVKLSGTRIGL